MRASKRRWKMWQQARAGVGCSPPGHDANLSQRLWYVLILTLIMYRHKKAEHQTSCLAHLVRSAGTGLHCALHARVEALLRRLAREVDGLPDGCAQGPTNREGSQRWVRVCCRVGWVLQRSARGETKDGNVDTRRQTEKPTYVVCKGRRGDTCVREDRRKEKERSCTPHELSYLALRAAARHAYCRLHARMHAPSHTHPPPLLFSPPSKSTEYVGARTTFKCNSILTTQ